MDTRIPFNKPFLIGNELTFIQDAVQRGKLSGDGYYTKQCQALLEEKYGFRKALLTTSCTDALEMAALLARVGPGDEVICPSYTFVSTANPFLLRGAELVFADSEPTHPNVSVQSIGELITEKTRAIAVVHYAGVACDMDQIQKLASSHNLLVIEDAAQAIDSYYRGKPLGSIGDFGTFSFHETKNIICGEGGALVLHDDGWAERAEIIREKGTDRSKFFRGEIDKYGWVDLGSSHVPSELNAAFLYAQLLELEEIQAARVAAWHRYDSAFESLGKANTVETPFIPEFATVNGHLYYLVCQSQDERDHLLQALKAKGILAVFHYQALHRSEFFKARHGDRPLPNAERFTECLVRLPLYYGLTTQEQDRVIEAVLGFFH